VKYQFHIGDLVKLKHEQPSSSRYSVLEVRGDNALLQTGYGPCLQPVTNCEPLNFDPRRIIHEDYVTN